MRPDGYYAEARQFALKFLREDPLTDMVQMWQDAGLAPLFLLVAAMGSRCGAAKSAAKLAMSSSQRLLLEANITQDSLRDQRAA